MSIGIDIGKYSVKLVELSSANNEISINKIGLKNINPIKDNKKSNNRLIILKHHEVL